MENFSENWKKILVVILIVLAFWVVLDYNRRAQRLLELETQLSIIETDVSQLHQTEMALYQEIAYATSVGGLDEYAREAGYKQEGDVAVVPISTGIITPSPTPYIAPEPVEVKNWEIWLAVFFGEKNN